MNKIASVKKLKPPKKGLNGFFETCRWKTSAYDPRKEHLLSMTLSLFRVAQV